MISVNHSIRIKAPVEIVWAFLLMGDRSMDLNRFHTLVRFDNGAKIKPDSRFIIDHSYGFSVDTMQARILDFLPGRQLIMEEKPVSSNIQGFRHTTSYRLMPDSAGTLFSSEVRGTFGISIKDTLFTALLHAVTLEELYKFKQNIESSEFKPVHLEGGGVSSV